MKASIPIVMSLIGLSMAQAVPTAVEQLEKVLPSSAVAANVNYFKNDPAALSTLQAQVKSIVAANAAFFDTWSSAVPGWGGISGIILDEVVTNVGSQGATVSNTASTTGSSSTGSSSASSPSSTTLTTTSNSVVGNGSPTTAATSTTAGSAGSSLSTPQIFGLSLGSYAAAALAVAGLAVFL